MHNIKNNLNTFISIISTKLYIKYTISSICLISLIIALLTNNCYIMHQSDPRMPIGIPPEHLTEFWNLTLIPGHGDEEQVQIQYAQWWGQKPLTNSPPPGKVDSLYFHFLLKYFTLRDFSEIGIGEGRWRFLIDHWRWCDP